MLGRIETVPIKPLLPSGTAQQGFSLIELIFYMLIGSVLLAVVTGVFISLYSVQENVLQSGKSAGELQLVATSVNYGVRNSTAVSLSETDSGQLLMAETLTGADEAITICQAWWFDGENMSIYAASGPTKESLPTVLSTNGWTLLSDKVEAIDGSPLFTQIGNTVAFSMKSTNSQGLVTDIRSQISGQGQFSESSSCF
jgi:prepilin-type N-terminal cleavage/methylation domain-containing protein